MRAAVLDMVQVKLHRVAIGTEINTDVAGIRRPYRVIGIGAGIQIIAGVDIVERRYFPVRGFGHQPDVEAVSSAIAVAMSGQRHPLVGRQAGANDGVFVFGVVMLAGGAGRQRGEREQRDEDG